MSEYLEKAGEYGKNGAGKVGGLGLGIASTPLALLGGASLIYGASKIEMDDLREVYGAAQVGMDQVNNYLEGDQDLDSLEAPEISDQSRSNLGSAVKYGVGAAVLGGIAALGYKKGRSMW